MEITLTANAGVCVSFGDTCVLVDALHEKSSRFSPVSADMVQKVMEGAFGEPALYLVTHAHGDHYSEALATAFLEKYPRCIFAGPVPAPADAQSRAILVEGRTGEAFAGPVRLAWEQLVHEGDEYADVVNYGYRVECGGESFIVLGDASSRETRRGLQALVLPDGTDAALVNFPVIVLRHGRQALQGLPIRRVVGFHLPFAPDDEDGYRKSAFGALSKAGRETGLRVDLLSEEGQTVTIAPQP